MIVPTDTTRCRSCGALITFAPSPNGRLTPYDVDPKTWERGDSHFKTCPAAYLWSRRSQRPQV